MTDIVPGATHPPDARTRLMRTAERLLASSNDGQVSTREICAGANVTAPTLYHHFKDKAALLDEVILAGFNAYLDEKRSVARSADAVQDFRRGWDMHVSFGCTHPAHYRLMFGNPHPEHVPPAARLASDNLAETVAEWSRDGRLLVPVDVATATMSSAAVGVTLQLIAMQADSTHPVSTNVRDTIATALFGRIDDAEQTTGPGPAARQLLKTLPEGPLAPLRPSETALLREWLSAISGRSENQEKGTS